MQKRAIELFADKQDCCGCTACYASCPTQAITMIPDEEGFLYPGINADKCISCGKCQRVCPIKTPGPERKPLGIYALKHQCDDVRARSTSGGGFTAVARRVEAKKGTIYGVTLDKTICAVHRAAEKEKDWQAFRSSKYMQSVLGDVIAQVAQDLERGKWVLFTGTPCQVDGLRHGLSGKNTEKLITCDLVCYGAPSPMIWRDYLSYLQRKTRRTVGNVNFRDKRAAGWHESKMTVRDRLGLPIVRDAKNKNPYFLLFSNQIISRPSCHQCRYASLSRPGDLTLGDYWGVEKHFAEYDDDKGITLFMVNSPKGQSVWEDIKSDTVYLELTQDQCLQPSLCHPPAKGYHRDAFWSEYHRSGFEKAADHCGFLPPSKADWTKYYVRTALGKVKKKLLGLLKRK